MARKRTMVSAFCSSFSTCEGRVKMNRMSGAMMLLSRNLDIGIGFQRLCVLGDPYMAIGMNIGNSNDTSE